MGTAQANLLQDGTFQQPIGGSGSPWVNWTGNPTVTTQSASAFGLPGNYVNLTFTGGRGSNGSTNLFQDFSYPTASPYTLSFYLNNFSAAPASITLGLWQGNTVTQLQHFTLAANSGFVHETYVLNLGSGAPLPNGGRGYYSAPDEIYFSNSYNGEPDPVNAIGTVIGLADVKLTRADDDNGDHKERHEVPEPATTALLGLGLGATLLARRRK